MDDQQENTSAKMELPQLAWSEEIGRGQYANAATIIGTENEVVIDFTFRTGVTTGAVGESPVARAAHIHIARIILTSQTAVELRNALNSAFPNKEG